MSTVNTDTITHGLVRTSPDGEEYVGLCAWCKEEDLPAEAADWTCHVVGMRCSYCGHPQREEQC